MEHVKVIKRRIFTKFKNTDIFKKILDVSKSQNTNLNTITEQRYDELSIFIEQLKT